MVYEKYFEGLIFGCTAFKAKCKKCPFEKIWKIPIEERIELLDELSENEKIKLVEQHFEQWKEFRENNS